MRVAVYVGGARCVDRRLSDDDALRTGSKHPPLSLCDVKSDRGTAASRSSPRCMITRTRTPCSLSGASGRSSLDAAHSEMYPRDTL
eukprot:238513-Rhodomonas_salina.1